MESQFPAWEPPSKRQLQIQGPRPTPLKVSKDFYKIKKPPHPPSHAAGPAAAAAADKHRREPVIIYAEKSDFMSIVQRYTGLSAGNFSGDGDVSPAARLAATEKASPSSRENIGDVGVAGEGGMEEGLIRAPPGILSPAPETLPEVAAGTFFSPAVAGGTFFSPASEARMMSADIIYVSCCRKARRIRTVSVHSDTVLGGPPADGYKWRKYGQKDILIARFPR
ncbi:WRKY domain - like 10 [Theobroma cacao]|nr:WRKY domain - like 10 [Theobroma cacao]